MRQPIRVVIAGMGMRGAWGVPAVLAEPRMRVVGLVDAVCERAELLAAEHGLADLPCLASLDEALGGGGGAACDAVIVLTPDGTHADLVIPALDAGKWVFVEKPLDVTPERCDAIIAADERAGRRTFVGLNLRYAPVYVAVHDLIASGVVGRVLTIQADEFYDGGRNYFRRWHRSRAVSGGLWVTKACHDFDLLHWMAGAAPVSVSATSALTHYVPRADAAMHCRNCALAPDCPDRYDLSLTPGRIWARLNEVTERVTGERPDLCLYNSEKDAGAFDHGAAMVRFANDVIATYTLNVVAGFTNRRMRVGGTRATIDADLTTGHITILHRDPPRAEQVTVGTAAVHGGADDQVMPAFADFVAGKRGTRYTSPAEAAVAVRMGTAAQASCDAGQTIALGEGAVSASWRRLRRAAT